MPYKVVADAAIVVTTAVVVVVAAAHLEQWNAKMR
jgi:hypothetical protein